MFGCCDAMSECRDIMSEVRDTISECCDRAAVVFVAAVVSCGDDDVGDDDAVDDDDMDDAIDWASELKSLPSETPLSLRACDFSASGVDVFPGCLLVLPVAAPVSPVLFAVSALSAFAATAAPPKQATGSFRL